MKPSGKPKRVEAPKLKVARSLRPARVSGSAPKASKAGSAPKGKRGGPTRLPRGKGLV